LDRLGRFVRLFLASFQIVRERDISYFPSRKSVASLADAGLQLIGKALARTQMRTTKRYAHFRDDPLHALFHEIGEQLKGGGKAGVSDPGALRVRIHLTSLTARFPLRPTKVKL